MTSSRIRPSAATGALGNGRKQWVRMSPRRSRDSTSSRDGGGWSRCAMTGSPTSSATSIAMSSGATPGVAAGAAADPHLDADDQVAVGLDDPDAFARVEQAQIGRLADHDGGGKRENAGKRDVQERQDAEFGTARSRAGGSRGNCRDRRCRHRQRSWCRCVARCRRHRPRARCRPNRHGCAGRSGRARRCRPLASTVCSARSGMPEPIAATRPPPNAISVTSSRPLAGSMTRPPLMIRSSIARSARLSGEPTRGCGGVKAAGARGGGWPSPKGAVRRRPPPKPSSPPRLAAGSTAPYVCRLACAVTTYCWGIY